MLEKFFKLTENKTDVKTEVMAGITTFMTMAYILAVNPSILSAAGMDANAVLIATAIASFVGTAMMALFANYPFALARYGTECLLCLYCSITDGLFLADCIIGSVCRRSDFYRTFYYQCA